MLSVPRVGIEWPARRLPKDEAIADRRVHDLIDLEIVEQPLGHVDDAVRIFCLRRGNGALIDRAPHVQTATAGAGTDYVWMTCTGNVLHDGMEHSPTSVSEMCLHCSRAVLRPVA